MCLHTDQLNTPQVNTNVHDGRYIHEGSSTDCPHNSRYYSSFSMLGDGRGRQLTPSRTASSSPPYQSTIRAGIMGGCKSAESHVEEREVRKEKRTGGSLAAGCCGRVRLCLWPRMPLAAHSQPAAGAEQAQSRAPSRPRGLSYCPCSQRKRTERVR